MGLWISWHKSIHATVAVRLTRTRVHWCVTSITNAAKIRNSCAMFVLRNSREKNICSCTLLWSIDELFDNGGIRCDKSCVIFISVCIVIAVVKCYQKLLFFFQFMVLLNRDNLENNTLMYSWKSSITIHRVSQKRSRKR